MPIEQGREQEILDDFAKGQRLYHLLNNEGWQDVLDILEAEVIRAEFKTLNIELGASEQLSRDLRIHARATRALFERMQLRIMAAIELGKNQIPSKQDDSQYYGV